MALRRSITARAKLLYQQQRVALPFSHVRRDDDDHTNSPHYHPISKNPQNPNSSHRRQFGAGYNLDTFHRPRQLFFVRNMSSFGEGWTDKSEIISDVPDVLGDKVAEVASQVAPVVNEVAVAAADCSYPVAALQYLIDYVHIYTGCNWWVSIVLATVLVRTLQLPLMIMQLRDTSPLLLSYMLLEKLIMNGEVAKNPAAADKAIIEGMDPRRSNVLSNFNGIFVASTMFCWFFLAINNMAKNVPSFKDGGALWFTDLATPDPICILPLLTTLTFLMMMKCYIPETMLGIVLRRSQRNAYVNNIAMAIFPLTLFIPKAILCYWITSNLFTLAYGLGIKNPEVKKRLGISRIRVPPDAQRPTMEEMVEPMMALLYAAKRRKGIK